MRKWLWLIIFELMFASWGIATAEKLEPGLPLQICHEVSVTRKDTTQKNKSVIRLWTLDTYDDTVDAELAALIGLTADQFTEEAFKEMINNQASVLEFVAATTTGNSITIAREQLPVGIAEMDEAAYFTLAMSMMEEAFTDAGYENLSHEISTVSFLGEERTCMNLNYTVSGVDLCQTMVLVQAPGYISVVTTTGADTASCAEILGYFYAIAD